MACSHGILQKMIKIYCQIFFSANQKNYIKLL